MMVGAAAQAWSMVPTFTVQRTKLLSKASVLRSSVQAMGFDTGTSATHIVPIIIGSSAKVLNIQSKLSGLGCFVSAIRPPSVAPGTARLRIALNIGHTDQNIFKREQALSEILK